MIDYKFREDELIAEFQRYVDSTYTQHYSTNKFQSTEIIIERGHGTGFCMGNVDKYSNRYGNKGTRDDARKDLMKILHYALIQLYVHDRETQELDDLFNNEGYDLGEYEFGEYDFDDSLNVRLYEDDITVSVDSCATQDLEGITVTLGEVDNAD